MNEKKKMAIGHIVTNYKTIRSSLQMRTSDKNLAEGEIQPYATISVGKQTSESVSGLVPGYYQITFSPSGITGGFGYDYTISDNALPVGLSVSAGLTFGSSSNAGLQVGATAGARNIRVEGGTTLDFRQQYVGLVLSTSTYWISTCGGLFGSL
jgi:hypothetical protein